MATLSPGEWTCPTAAIGSESPHAGLLIPYAPVAHYEGAEHPVDQCVPYRQLDGYNRNLVPTTHRTLVLESDRLVATFLPDLGGRLWSLVHKPTGRELLYVNPVIQPANFAIRNAWFSGGIEWNVGVFGHSVFTCSPVFCGRTVAPDGSQGLRIWEYERVRGVAWQVDFWAPDGSDHLYYMPRMVNPHTETIPMYWWTCIAVEEVPEGRVLAPTNWALEPGRAMGEKMTVRNLLEEPDITVPQRRDLPRDTYFDIPDGERPWIAHVAGNGEGVVHASSPLLKGRKQWVWGMERCGRRWQDWLSPGGPPYIEIQGGLAKKQSDYVPMPGGADWSWIESYGPVGMSDAFDWSTAIEGVRGQLPQLDERESAMVARLQLPVDEVLHHGSGWGALEEKRRLADGEAALLPEGPRFPVESMGEAQGPWLALLDNGQMPEHAPVDACVGPAWEARLGKHLEWWTLVHQGTLAYFERNFERARELWTRSLGYQLNAPAMRSLALLDEFEGDLKEAAAKMVHSLELQPGDLHLVDDACRLLAASEEWEGLQRLLDRQPPAVRFRPRARLAMAQAFLATGQLEVVRDYFDAPCDLVDIREAETSVSDLWKALGEEGPPPREYDFRMV